jgi:hypothetical protein
MGLLYLFTNAYEIVIGKSEWKSLFGAICVVGRAALKCDLISCENLVFLRCFIKIIFRIGADIITVFRFVP